MSPDDIRNAEQRGYSRGYQAGIRRVHREAMQEKVTRQRNANWNRVFLAVLPGFLQAQGWTIDNEPANNIEKRMELAVRAANKAADRMKIIT